MERRLDLDQADMGQACWGFGDQFSLGIAMGLGSGVGRFVISTGEPSIAEAMSGVSWSRVGRGRIESTDSGLGDAGGRFWRGVG